MGRELRSVRNRGGLRAPPQNQLGRAMWRAAATLLLVMAPAEVAGGVEGGLAAWATPNSVSATLESFKGSRAGVDVSGKLVAAALTFSAELHRGEETHGHFAIVHEYIHLLIGALGAAALIVVFDGDRFPAKAETHRKRAEAAEKSALDAACADAEAATQTGAAAAASREAARKAWKQVLHRGALLELKEFTMELCMHLGVAYIVAPYEADSQLAALHHWGYIDLVIAPTNDSDFLFYGVSDVLYKMQRDGACLHCRVFEHVLNRTELETTGWTLAQLVRFGVASGCDYWEGVPSARIKTLRGWLAEMDHDWDAWESIYGKAYQPSEIPHFHTSISWSIEWSIAKAHWIRAWGAAPRPNPMSFCYGPCYVLR